MLGYTVMHLKMICLHWCSGFGTELIDKPLQSDLIYYINGTGHLLLGKLSEHVLNYHKNHMIHSLGFDFLPDGKLHSHVQLATLE